MTVVLSSAQLRQIHRRSHLGWRRHSFLLAVIAPTVLVCLYLVLIAAPRYTVELRYSVFSDTGTRTDNLELVSSSGRASKLSDFMVADYVTSPQMVSDLSAKLNLANMFNPPGLDFIFRFWWNNGTNERLADYWRNWVISSHFDVYSELGVIEVSAFTPQDALKLAQTVLALSEITLNAQEQRARDAAVIVAQELLTRTQARTQAVRQKIVEFRQTQRTYQPNHPADSTETLAATLRHNLAAVNAQIQSLSTALSPNAPALVILRSQQAAIEREVDRVMNTFGKEDTEVSQIQPNRKAAGERGVSEASTAGRLPVALGEYQSLESDLHFAEAANEVALTHFEQVTYNAKVQHFYMNTYARPLLPKQANFPRTIVWTLMTFIILSVCWMIGKLLFLAMRDLTR